MDAAIVVVEQTHKKLEEWQTEGGQGDADSTRKSLKNVIRPLVMKLVVD